MFSKTSARRLFTVLGLVLAFSIAARGEEDAAKDAKSGEGLKRMQGEWTVSSAGTENTTYTFKDDTLSVKAPRRSYEIAVTLDEAAKPEKTIDLKIEKAPDDAKGKTSKGIYKFDGEDKLVICFRPEGERPAKFEQVGFEQFLVELTRKKAEAK